MINKPTCYRNPDKRTCIDLILTNCPGSFQNSCVIETGLSDFHKMIVTVMKTSYRKIEPRVINYRDYKSFSNEGFRESLLKREIIRKLWPKLWQFHKYLQYYVRWTTSEEKESMLEVINRLLWIKLSKAIILRTNLRNKFLKNRSNENKTNYLKQRTTVFLF